MRVDYDDDNGYCVYYFDEPMELYDTFAQAKTAVEQFKAAIANNAEAFTFPTVEELTSPPVEHPDNIPGLVTETAYSKEQLGDSLTRAMKTALEKFQEFCLVKNLTAAENELKLYNICREATRELWKEVTA